MLVTPTFKISVLKNEQFLDRVINPGRLTTCQTRSMDGGNSLVKSTRLQGRG